MTPHLFVLYGATGDLAKKKLLPALYHACRDMPEGRFVLLGTARSDWDDERMRDAAVEALTDAGVGARDAKAWAKQSVYYVPVGREDGLGAVFDRAALLEAEHETGGNRVHYLSIPPKAFPGTIETIGQHERMTDRDGWTRLVVEKPFGQDLRSAQELNALVHTYFDEEQVYRIDHFLGKETVQNLLVFRFANALFESLWNREHVEQVEITVAESIGTAGRAGYYDGVGAMKDMIQNHLTQLLTLTAMEPPARLDAEGLKQEKTKVLRAARVDVDATVYGQYTAGANGQKGYAEHDGVPRSTRTETYAAVRLRVDNWRWQGVPFVLRTGKRLAEKRSEIVVRFRCAPVQLFQGMGPCEIASNVLRIRLQPDEGFRLAFEVKQPGDGFSITTQELDFAYDEAFDTNLPGAYDTLLQDIAEGDRMLFVDAEEVETAWALYAPLLDHRPTVHRYPSGSWGPDEAEALLAD